MSNLLTISYGDTESGAALLEAVLGVMADAGVVLEIETVQLGAEMVKLGYEQGFDGEGLSKIRRAGVLLKAPTEKNITADLQNALGDEYKIFEPGEASMAAMLKSAVEMLHYLGQSELADRIVSADLG